MHRFFWKKLVLFRTLFCQDQEPDQDRSFTLNFNTRITFYILNRQIEFGLDPRTPLKDIVSTDRQTDRRSAFGLQI